MKRETQLEKLTNLLLYAFASRDVAESHSAAGEHDQARTVMIEMRQNLLLTFTITRKKS